MVNIIYNMKFREWVVINWYKVIGFDWKDKISIICWICWAYWFKTRKRIYDSKWCQYCKIRKDWFNKYKKEWYSWVLQIPMNTIDSRLKRWKSFKQAIWLEPLSIPKENFSDNDLLYLSKFNNDNYDRDKQIAEKAYLKFKTNN